MKHQLVHNRSVLLIIVLLLTGAGLCVVLLIAGSGRAVGAAPAVVPDAAMTPQSDPLWTQITPTVSAGTFWDVAVGDVNHDGNPDVVGALFYSFGVRVWLGDGAGNWVASTTGLSTTGAYRGVALGDLDVDGTLDIVAASAGDGIRVWSGDGSGGWGAVGSPVTSGSYSDVGLAHVNNDGLLDIVATTSDGNGIRAWLGDGGGGWTPDVTGLPATGTYHGLAVGDVNNRGYMGLAASPDSGGLVVYYRAPSGTWYSQSDYLPTSGAYRGVALADLDDEPELELIAASVGAGVQVWDMDGAGDWQEVDSGLPSSGVFRDVAVADVNNDGKPDIGASLAAAGLRTWVGNGQFAFFPASNGLPLTTGGYAGLAFGDLDDDGQADLFAASTDPGGVRVWQNGRTPVSWLGWSVGTEPGQASTWNDVALTPDGLVAVGTASNCVWIWEGDGTTWTVESGLPCTNDGLTHVAVGDLNHDGKWNLVAATEANGLRAWVGSGSTWSSFDTGLPTTGTYNGIALGDINHDGHLDIAAAGNGFGMRVWMGDSAGNWIADSTGLPTTGTWWDLALGDMNNDGILDLLATSQDGTGIQMWGWIETVSWGDRGPAWVGDYYGLDVGDINDDGNLDIAAARAGLGGVEMYYGDGSFGIITGTSPYTQPVAMYAKDVALGDVNHDGKLDLAAVGEDPVLNLGRLSFWFGDGGSGWAEGHPPNAEADSGVVILGPLNDDGFLDMVAIKTTGDIWPWLAGDFAAPTGWFPYTPDDWVTSTRYPTCTTVVHDSISGLDVDSVYYSYSTSGGANWSSWQEAECSGSDGVTSTQTITAAAVAFDQDSGQTDLNKIRYLIRDVAGNWGLSPERSVQIDTTPPQNPTTVESTSHTSGGWSNDTTIDGQWSGATDATSGVDGYGLLWSTSPTVPPATVLDTYGTSDTSPSLDDGQWYLAVRTKDVAGNWADDAGRAGPFGIDTVAPSNPTSISSSSHTVDVWSADNTIDVSWSGAADSDSGVYGYSVAWTHSATFVPDQLVDTTTASATSTPLDDDDDWYFHVRTRDVAGNWSADAGHFGPFRIDTTPPDNPTGLLSSHYQGGWSSDNTVYAIWYGDDDGSGSGVGGYSLVWDRSSTLVPDSVQDTSDDFDTSDPLDDDDWYLHVRTVDAVGNWNSGATHYGPFRIDTTPPTNPTSLWSTSHTPGVWSTDVTIDVHWSGAEDAGGSGVEGYAIDWSRDPSTEPFTTIDTTDTSATSGWLVDNDDWWFHLRTGDDVGNWTAGTLHLGPFMIDSAAPESWVSLPSISGGPTFTVTWGATDDGSGLATSATYDVDYRADGGAWQSLHAGTTITSSVFGATVNGTTYRFRARARDAVGQEGDWSDVASILVGNVKVVHEDGHTVDGEVYLNGQLVGTAGGDGYLYVSAVTAGDELVARYRVAEFESRKGHHVWTGSQDWAYRVYITNVGLDGAGEAAPHQVVDPGTVQELVLRRDQAVVGAHILASVEWDASQAYLEEVREGLVEASRYLYDAGDGQFFWEAVEVVDDGLYWRDADIRIHASNAVWPTGNYSGIWERDGQIYLGRQFNGGTSNAGLWTEPNGYRTMVHEFGHYVSLRDEYLNRNGVETANAWCSTARDTLPDETERGSIMDRQYDCTEFCSDLPTDPHRTQTLQDATYDESTWETLARRFSDKGASPDWVILTPVDRGHKVAGPTSLPVDDWINKRIRSNADTGVCAPFILDITPGGLGSFTLADSSITVIRPGGKELEQGGADQNGDIEIRGAHPGDTIHAYGSFPWFLVSAPYQLEWEMVGCTPSLLTGADASPATAAPQSPPQMGVLVIPQVISHEVSVQLHASVPLTGTPVVWLRQAFSSDAISVTVAYSAALDAYVGEASLDPALPEVGVARAIARAETGELGQAFSHFAITSMGDEPLTPLLFPDGNLMMFLPAGSLPVGTRVGITRLGRQVVVQGEYARVGKLYHVAAADGTTTLPVEAGLNLQYGASVISHVSVDTLQIARWDGDTDRWTTYDGYVGKDHRIVSAMVDQLGTYALIGSTAREVYLPLVLRDY